MSNPVGLEVIPAGSVPPGYTGPADGDTLVFNSETGRWEARASSGTAEYFEVSHASSFAAADDTVSHAVDWGSNFLCLNGEGTQQAYAAGFMPDWLTFNESNETDFNLDAGLYVVTSLAQAIAVADAHYTSMVGGFGTGNNGGSQGFHVGIGTEIFPLSTSDIFSVNATWSGVPDVLQLLLTVGPNNGAGGPVTFTQLRLGFLKLA